MAKELPYFRFTAFEWLNDDISLESYQLKGLFIDICAYYWFKDCSLDLLQLNKRFSNARDLLQQLFNIGILKLNKETDLLEINFLDEQYDILSDKRKKRQEAGKIGGLKKSSNAKAMLKQKSSYKDKDKDKDKNKDNDKYYKQFAHLKITEKDHNKLVDNYGELKVNEIYIRIENYRKNTNYKSLYLTALDWLKKDKLNNKVDTNKITSDSVCQNPEKYPNRLKFER